MCLLVLHCPQPTNPTNSYARHQHFMDEVHTETTLARDIQEATGVEQTWHANVNFTTRMMVER